MLRLGGNTVLFGYKFQNFQGETEVPTELEVPVSWVTHCQEFGTSQDTAVPLITANLTNPDYELRNTYRWIIQVPNDQVDDSGYLNGSAHLYVCH